MNDEQRNLPPEERVSERTSRRVAEMSDAERAELARELARRKAALPGPPARRAAEAPAVRRRAEAADDAKTRAKAKAVARLTAELRTTERHLDRLERSITPSRYQGGSAAPQTARYARLLSRADRLERQLRALR